LRQVKKACAAGKNFYCCKMLVFKLKMLGKLRFFVLKNVKIGTFFVENGKSRTSKILK
jgi:hypothetical protein